ncbi:MAG: methyltransferase domain-containing protein [Burkholderiaceae bacterium]|nr:MAG: methyltransferase domain-containing protein [Burkholderiaceae bacterium]
MQPTIDLAPITRHLRAMYSSRLLIAATHYFNVFDRLSNGPKSSAALQRELELKDRPAMVLFPALCGMDMLMRDAAGNLSLTELGRGLTTDGKPSLHSYLCLEKDEPTVVEMVERLRNDGPLDKTKGIAYTKEGDEPSPMDDPEAARFLTLALSGRALYLSPLVAEALPARKGHLLDVACGTGVFAYEWLLRNPESTATILDSASVLAVAAEFLESFVNSGRPGANTLRDRVRLLPGDMLVDDLPRADIVLAASLFHDWPEPTCEKLAQRFAQAVNPGGELWVHDLFLDDTLDGPLAATDYSAMLFWVTKGRAYSRKEYRRWLADAGLKPTTRYIPTRVDYGLISAVKPA